jgi:hypothetical protein
MIPVDGLEAADHPHLHVRHLHLDDGLGQRGVGVGVGTECGGRLDADGSFAARTDNAARLIDNVTVSADFRVKRGVLYNADITAAAVGDASGGTTQFEELTGTVETAGRSVSLRRIQLKSGPLTAKGTLDVTPSRQIQES